MDRVVSILSKKKNPYNQWFKLIYFDIQYLQADTTLVARTQNLTASCADRKWKP